MNVYGNIAEATVSADNTLVRRAEIDVFVVDRVESNGTHSDQYLTIGNLGSWDIDDSCTLTE
jgi:hypothetical protein